MHACDLHAHLAQAAARFGVCGFGGGAGLRALQNGHQTIPVVPWAVDVLDHGPAHAVGPVVRVILGLGLGLVLGLGLGSGSGGQG